MIDGFQISDKWMIELFDMEYVLNIMDKKKNKEVVDALVKLQGYFIQELEYLIEEKQKGCFSIYENLLNVYNAENHNLVNAFSDNPVLEFQQKIFQERQQNYNQLINEKNQFILETQITLLQGFPKLNENFNNFRNLIGNINLLIIENKNNSNLTILFKFLHNQFKEKLQYQYSQTLDNYSNLSNFIIQIEKLQLQLNNLDEKAVSLNSILSQLKLVQDSLLKASQTKFNSPYKQSLKTKFDILEDVKFNFQARKYILHTQLCKQNLEGQGNVQKDGFQGFSFAEDRKNYIQSLLDDKDNKKSRSNSNNKQSSIERSPMRSIHSTRLEEQWSLTQVENHEEYQLEKAKKKCILLIEEIMELDIKRQTNNIILQDTVHKEMQSLSEKQKFIASSIYRTLKLIKFKFEQIHQNQQSSLYNISSFRTQSKTSVEERDRIILQLFGEANLLCCDYELNFSHENNTSTSDQLSQKLVTSGDSQKIQHSNRSKYQRSQSAGKINNNTTTLQSSKYQSKPLIKNKDSSSTLNISNVSSYKNIHQQKQSPDDRIKKMKKCQSFVENQVQRILSSQKLINNKLTSPQKTQNCLNQNYHVHSISPSYKINTTNKPSINQHQQYYNDENTQQNNISYCGSNHSIQNISSPKSVHNQSQLIYNNPISENIQNHYEQSYYLPKPMSTTNLCNKLRTDLSDTSSLMYGSPNITKKVNSSNSSQNTLNNASNVNISSNQALNQIGRSIQTLNKINGSSQSLNQTNSGSSQTLNQVNQGSQTFIQAQNTQQYCQQKQEMNRNKFTNNSMHNSSEHRYTQYQVLQNQNFYKKQDTIKIGQFLNNNHSFSSNQSLAQIKNLIKSPKSQNDPSSFGSQNKINHNKNQSLVSNQSQQIVQPNQGIIRNRSLHEIKKQPSVQQRKEPIKQNQMLAYQEKENTFQQPNKTIANQENLNYVSNQQINKTQCNLNNSILSGKPKFGVVQIDINQIEQKQKDSIQYGSCSTIEQEQTNINLSKIHSTFNKNIEENGLMLLEGEDFVKFSFSNNINYNSIFNQTNKQYETQMKQQKNNNDNQLTPYQNLCKDIFNMNNTFNTDNTQTISNITKNNNKSNSLLSSTQDKENVYVQPISKSKEPKILKENITHRKLNNILQAATTSKGIDLNNNNTSNNNKRATALKHTQCKSPLSKDTSIYEGSNEFNYNQLESINSNFQSINKMLSSRSNSTIYDVCNQANNIKNLSQIQLNLIDLELGIPVYIRFNTQIILKKRVFDPLTMNIKDAINLGYILRIMKFNKDQNRLEFFREKSSQSKHLNFNGNSSYSICSNKQNQNKNDQNEQPSINNISMIQDKNFDGKRIAVEKYLLLSQIKKISIPPSTSSLYKFLNNQSQYQLPNNVHLDQKQLLQQNNFLLCIDSKECGLTEIIINTLQSYQTIYTSLSSILNTQTL